MRALQDVKKVKEEWWLRGTIGIEHDLHALSYVIREITIYLRDFAVAVLSPANLADRQT